jgi:hypothetical protein
MSPILLPEMAERTIAAWTDADLQSINFLFAVTRRIAAKVRKPHSSTTT